MDEAKEIEQSAHQLAELVSTFTIKVNEQEEKVEQLFKIVQDAKVTLDMANEQLQKSKDNASGGGLLQYFTLYVILMATLFLWLMDRVSS